MAEKLILIYQALVFWSESRVITYGYLNGLIYLQDMAGAIIIFAIYEIINTGEEHILSGTISLKRLKILKIILLIT